MLTKLILHLMQIRLECMYLFCFYKNAFFQTSFLSLPNEIITKVFQKMDQRTRTNLGLLSGRLAWLDFMAGFRRFECIRFDVVWYGIDITVFPLAEEALNGYDISVSVSTDKEPRRLPSQTTCSANFKLMQWWSEPILDVFPRMILVYYRTWPHSSNLPTRSGSKYR